MHQPLASQESQAVTYDEVIFQTDRTTPKHSVSVVEYTVLIPRRSVFSTPPDKGGVLIVENIVILDTRCLDSSIHQAQSSGLWSGSSVVRD